MLKRILLSGAGLIMLALGASAQDIWPEQNQSGSNANQGAVTEYAETVFEVADVPTSTYYRPFNFWIGPKIGGAIDFPSKLKEPNGFNVKTGGGFEAGLVANFRFLRPEDKPFGNERLGAQLEILYSMQSIGSDDKGITMHCFEIPVLFQYYPISSFGIEVGPTFKGVMGASPKDLAVGTSIYDMSKVKGMDVMVTFGVLYKHRSGFNIDLRYNLGNSNLAENFKTKVSTLSLSFGWLFPVIK